MKRGNVKNGSLLAIGLFLIYAVVMTLFLGSACPIFLIFGVPCPGCGLTRACFTIFSGDFLGAIKMHLLFLTLPIIAILILIAIFKPDLSKKKGFSITCIVLGVLFIAYYVYRMTSFPSDTPIIYNENSLLNLILGLFKK